MNDATTPVIVGVSQLVQREVDLDNPPEPLDMLADTAREAAKDAECGGRLLRSMDTVALINVAAWNPDNAPNLLAQRLDAHPRHEFDSEIGGQIGISVANHVADLICKEQVRIALIAGCNNLRTISKLRAKGLSLNWTQGGQGRPVLLGEVRPGSSDLERKYGLTGPTDIYPIFENALRAKRGLDLDTHRQSMGALFTRFTEIAAANPHAWFPVQRSARELTTVTPQNRMISFPYTKYLNAILSTDQAAALIMMSVEAARSFGVPEEKWIYWWGGAEAEEEAWWASERADFAASPAMLDSSLSALGNAGLDMQDIDFIDFYSCFPVAVEMACEMLGIDQQEHRTDFTVTGGLPYAGGPASAYTLHSLAAMVQKLRCEQGSKGMVTGNGWYLTKHAASVWSSEPFAATPTNGLLDSLPAQGLDSSPNPVVEERQGRGTIKAYTVSYDRDGEPVRGIVLGNREDGSRFLANTPDDSALLHDFVAREQVGQAGKVSFDGEMCRFEPD